MCIYTEQNSALKKHFLPLFLISFQANDALNDVDVHDPTRNRMDAPLNLPYPLASTRLAYFAFQSPDLRSLAVSKKRGQLELLTAIVSLTSSLELHRHLDYLIIISIRCVVHPSQAVRGSECSFSSPRFRDHLFPSKGLEGNVWGC